MTDSPRAVADLLPSQALDLPGGFGKANYQLARQHLLWRFQAYFAAATSDRITAGVDVNERPTAVMAATQNVYTQLLESAWHFEAHFQLERRVGNSWVRIPDTAAANTNVVIDQAIREVVNGARVRTPTEIGEAIKQQIPGNLTGNHSAVRLGLFRQRK